MKKSKWIITVLLFALLAQGASAAPLFSDVPANHWAKDAVAHLSAKGIVEGYPDGTFKGDRYATRWEMAMVVARLLAKDEQMWATFATKEDLEALKQLVNQLKDELDSLGVRVNNSQDNLGKLTKRVSGIEKILFYGSIDSIVAAQRVKSGAAYDPWGFPATSIYYIDNVIGSSMGPSVRPNGFSVFLPAAPPTGTYSAFPVVDYRNTKPLTTGGALTAVGILGAKIKVSDDADAKVEFAAYSMIGGPAVAAYSGVTPPYLSNIFTSDIGQTGLNNVNSCWTKITLDNAVIHYKKSGVKVQLGSFADTTFDPETLCGEPSPNAVNGPKYLPFFGLRVAGQTHFLLPMKFELLGTKFASDTTGNAAGTAYNTIVGGFALGWAIKGGDIKLNYLRASDDYFSGRPLVPGGTENPFAWQNFGEYFAVNTPQQTMRPVQAGDGANGLIGPQSQSTYGASVRYELFKNIKFEGFCGSTDYKPNINSNYQVNGKAARAKLTALLFKNYFDFGIEYAGASAFYDPFICTVPAAVSNGVAYGGAANLSGMPEPYYRLNLFSTGFYQLHRSELITSNRTGFKLHAVYRFPLNRGTVTANYGSFEQLAYSATMANGGLSNKPGFVEPFFSGMTGRETTKARTENFMLGADYKFVSKLHAKILLSHIRLKRPTSLTGVAAAANNNINVTKSLYGASLAYPLNDKFTLKGGYDFVAYKGAYRVLGLPNWDTAQNIPCLGFDYKINSVTDWSLTAEYFTVADYISPLVATSGGQWKWSGPRVYSEFKVSF